MDQEFSDTISRPEQLNAIVLTVPNDCELFKVPELPPWRKRPILTKKVKPKGPRILRISDSRKKSEKRQKMEHVFSIPMIDCNLNYEHLFSRKHARDFSVEVNNPPKISRLQDNCENLQQNGEDKMEVAEKNASAGRDLHAREVLDSKKSLKIVAAENGATAPKKGRKNNNDEEEEEDVNSEGEIDEELASLCRSMEENRRARINGGPIIPIPYADDVFDLEHYHLPTIYIKSQRKPNVLPPDVRVIPIEPFMEEWELLSEGRLAVNAALSSLHSELGINIDNPLQAFNDNCFLVQRLKTIDRGLMISRCNPRNTTMDPPLYGEFYQAVLAMPQGRRTRHPRANMYPAHYTYDNIAYCEDPYWEYHVGRRPTNLEIPFRPFDIAEKRRYGMLPPKFSKDGVPEKIAMLPPESVAVYNEMRELYLADLEAHGGVEKEHAYD